MWVTWYAISVLTSSFAFGTAGRTSTFLILFVFFFLNACAWDIPALWASSAFYALDSGSGASYCASLYPGLHFLCKLPLHWAGNCQHRKESRGISILYASVPLPRSQLQVRLKPEDLMKQRTATMLTLKVQQAFIFWEVKNKQFNFQQSGLIRGTENCTDFHGNGIFCCCYLILLKCIKNTQKSAISISGEC